MHFTIREMEPDRDMDYFITTEFEVAKENGFINLEKPEEEAFEEHKKELLEMITKKVTGVFFAEYNNEYAGLVWISLRSGGEIWDFEEMPAWVYDVRVFPQFRGQKLGKKLLAQAEEWAKNNGFVRIGLHVFAFNTVAISLYTTAGYTMKNCYLQKDIAEVTDTVQPFTIREKTSKDDKNFLALCYENFRKTALYGSTVAEKVIRKKYDTFMTRSLYDKLNHAVFIAEDKNQFRGFVWVYVSKGDLGKKRYVWMQDVGVVPEFQGKGVGRQLLAHMEKWTVSRGLDTVRTGMHARDHRLALLQSCGWKETNLFMEKVTE